MLPQENLLLASAWIEMVPRKVLMLNAQLPDDVLWESGVISTVL